MLTREDKWFLSYLAAGYLAFAEFLSWGTSQFPLCILVSQYQPANNNTGYETCATLHEGVMRGFAVLWGYTTHDNVVAASTVVIAAFTLTLWLSSEKMWRVTSDALQLAHRPRMRLKHMWLADDTAWRLGGPLEVNLDIVNVGNTEGFVTWVNYESILLPPNQRLPQRPPYDEMPFGPFMRITRFRTDVPLRPGITLARPVCDGRILDPQQVHDVLWGHQRLFLIGTIEYFDQGGGLRQTGFCRCLTFNAYPPAPGDLGRFDKEDDPDYEFEEWGQ